MIDKTASRQANRYDQKEYLTVTETAAIIRRRLKEAFPGVKFGVRSSRYAGGASIRISYIDGPKLSDVQAITNGYGGKGFDPMNDLAYAVHHWMMPDGTINGMVTDGSRVSDPAHHDPKPHPKARLVHFGSDHVFVSRRLSEDKL